MSHAIEGATPKSPAASGPGEPSLDTPRRLHVLGHLRVVNQDGGESVPVGDAQRSLLLLLAFHGAVHVEQAIDALWPTVDVSTGRRRLRNVLSRLHQCCGLVVRREGPALVLAVPTDLAEYEAAVVSVLAA
jgi:DNA-binding SARP family transcriptional activator